LIEVNLLPSGGKKTARRRSVSLRLPKFRGSIPRGNRWATGATIAVALSLVGSGWLFLSVGSQLEELEIEVETAVRDSIRFADVIEQSSLLQARADSIAERVSVIQTIDEGRYVGPHLLDEVARAMPEYAWLTRLYQVNSEELPVFQIEGRSGTYFALTSLMENLEASPFIGGVQLIASQQVTLSTGEEGGERLLYEFVLEATARPPPPELIETVPLFGPSIVPLQPEAGD
jgi:Tfp pilus assembly protein PilN